MRPAGFALFGPSHLAILALIAMVAVALTLLARSWPGRGARAVRIGLGSALAANELVWYGYRYTTEGWRFPEGLPLQLCDVLVWASVLAALRLTQWAVELVYFAGIAGAGMATLTPDLWAPWPSYPTVYYFVVHGLILIVAMVILGAGLARPRPGCLRRVLVFVNLYAAGVGLFNWRFGSNYMYLCRKPGGATLLDWFGPWPWYLLAGELAAAGLFGLLWLPWWGRGLQSLRNQGAQA